MKRLILLLAVLVALPAAAQEPQLSAHLITSVELGTSGRVPVEIIRAESTLQTGRSYSDVEIRLAVDRVKRLPFVVDAIYTLEPDPQGGGSRLVITIFETKPFTYELDARGTLLSDDSGIGASTNVNLRTFVGRRGMLEGTLGSLAESGSVHGRSLSLRYTAFDLFGTGARAAIALSKGFGDGGGPLAPTVNLSFPIDEKQTITAFATRVVERSESRFFMLPEPLHAEQERRVAELLWNYQTTDDPIFPRSGTSISIGPRWTVDRSDREIPSGFPTTVLRTKRETRELSLGGRVAQYFPIREREVLFGRLTASQSHVERELNGAPDSESENTMGTVAIGFARDFGDNRPLATGARHRLELSIEHSLSRFAREGSPTRNSELSRIVAGWTFRHAWGRVSLIGQYIVE